MRRTGVRPAVGQRVCLSLSFFSLRVIQCTQKEKKFDEGSVVGGKLSEGKAGGESHGYGCEFKIACSFPSGSADLSLGLSCVSCASLVLVAFLCLNFCLSVFVCLSSA